MRREGREGRREGREEGEKKGGKERREGKRMSKGEKEGKERYFHMRGGNPGIFAFGMIRRGTCRECPGEGIFMGFDSSSSSRTVPDFIPFLAYFMFYFCINAQKAHGVICIMS